MPSHRPLTPGDPYGPILLHSLLNLTITDMLAAIDRNSEYRERAAVQWATLLARRAFEYQPSLRPADGRDLP